MSHLTSKPVTKLDLVAYIFIALIILVGIILARYNNAFFLSTYIREDGVLEYLTAFLLFCASILSFARLFTCSAGKTKAFFATTLFIALLMLFGAGEEVSWGQRIFGIESNAFFQEHNRQAETNFHNLSIAGININKLVFSKIAALFFLLYYLILPWVYRYNSKVRNLFDRFYIPVPKIQYGLVMVLAGLSILLVESSKKGELNEVCASIVFFLTLFTPQNRHIYKRDT